MSTGTPEPGPTWHADNEVPTELRHRDLAEGLPIGLMCCRDGRITYLNKAALRLLGVSSIDEVRSRPFLDFIAPEYRELAISRGTRILNGEHLAENMVRQRLKRPDGSTVDIEAVTVPFEDSVGKGTFSWAIDVSQQVRAERALQDSEQRWRSLVQNASDLIAVLNGDGSLRFATPAAERLLGYTSEGVEGIGFADYIHPEDLPRVVTAVAQVVSEPDAQNRTEFRLIRPDGTYCWLESIATNRFDDPAVAGIICNIRDVSDRRVAEDALRHQATHDALTGLPNRLALTDKIAGDTAAGEEAALLLLDLDGFKDINDGLGHDVGDRILVGVGHRLQSLTRESDLVSRLGGDEFAIWITGAEGKENATVIASKLLASLGEAFDLDGTSLVLAASIGVAYAPDHGTTPSALLQAADVAMYRAKEKGMSWAVHSAEDLRERRHRLTVISQLRQALESEVLEVYYQPQVELATGVTLGVEALLRWGPHLGGPLMPDEFIPLAERTGLIGPLTEYVLTRALRQRRHWRNEGLDLNLAVNLSAASLRDPTLVSAVSFALAEAGLPASCLTLEITESGLADPNPGAVRILGHLRERGVRLTIDDLGIGYSSLSYLKRLPINEVKIDKSFLRGMDTERDWAIVRSLVGLGHSLGLSVIAEGVETLDMHACLVESGCDLAQGFLYCRPQPAPVVTEWLLQHQGMPPAIASYQAPLRSGEAVTEHS